MTDIQNYQIKVDNAAAGDDIDAFFTYAEHSDGTALTLAELQALSYTHKHLLQDAVRAADWVKLTG
jgi:hypothetical protein